MAVSVRPTIPTEITYEEYPFRDIIRPPDVSLVGATSFDFVNTLTLENITVAPSDNLLLLTSSRKGFDVSNPTNPATGASFGSADLVQMAAGASQSNNAVSTSVWMLKGSDLTAAQQNTPTDLVVTWPQSNWGCVATAFLVNSDRVSEHDIAGMTAMLVLGTNDGVNSGSHSVSYTPTFAHSTLLGCFTLNDNNGNNVEVGNKSHDVVSFYGDGMCTTPGPDINIFVSQLIMIDKQSGMTDMTFSFDTFGYPDPNVAQFRRLIGWVVEIPGKPIREYSINGEKLGKRLLNKNCNMMVHSDSLFSTVSDNRLFCSLIEKCPFPINSIYANSIVGSAGGDTSWTLASNAVANLSPVNEEQKISYNDVSSVGTYNINYNSAVSTGTPINTDSATSGAVLSHLELLPGFGSGDFAVSGTTLTDFTITFQGTGAAQNMLLLGIQDWSGGGLGPASSQSVASSAGASGHSFNVLGTNPGTTESYFGSSISSGPTGSLLPTMYNETLYHGEIPSGTRLAIPCMLTSRPGSAKSYHANTYGGTSHYNSHIVDWQNSDFLFDPSLSMRLFYLEGPSGAVFNFYIADFAGAGIFNDFTLSTVTEVDSSAATEKITWADLTAGGLDPAVFNDTTAWRRGGSDIRTTSSVESPDTGIIVFGTRIWSPSAAGIGLGTLNYGGAGLVHHTSPDYTNTTLLAQMYEGNQVDTPVNWMLEGTALETTINLWKDWINIVGQAVADARVNDPTIQDPLIVIVATYPAGSGNVETTTATRVYESELARLALENPNVVFMNVYRMSKDKFGEYGASWNSDARVGYLADGTHPTYVGGCSFIKMFYQEAIHQAIEKLPSEFGKQRVRFNFVSGVAGGASAVQKEVPNIVGPLTEQYKLVNVMYSINAASANGRVNVEYSGGSVGLGYTGESKYPILTLSGSGQLDMRDSHIGMRFSMIEDFSGNLTVTPVNMGPNDSYNIVLEYE